MTSRTGRHAATMAELSVIAALTWLYAHPLLDLRADTVPFVLGLAALGVDRVFRRSSSPGRAPQMARASFGHGPQVVLLLLLIAGLVDTATFNGHWLKTIPWPNDLEAVLGFLRVPGVQWVSPPYAEDLYTEPAIRAGLKLADAWQPWSWKDRESSRALLLARRNDDAAGVPPGAVEQGRWGDLTFYTQDPRATVYALVSSPDGQVKPCPARATGGDIDLRCPAAAGLLTVHEHAWPGWKATVDGQPAPLRMDDWIQLELPPGGQGRVSLRYRPWDAVMGLLLAALGGMWTVYLLWGGRRIG